MSMTKDIRENTIREVIDALERKMANADIAVSSCRSVQADLMDVAMKHSSETGDDRLARQYAWRGRGLEAGLEISEALISALRQLTEELEEELQDD